MSSPLYKEYNGKKFNKIFGKNKLIKLTNKHLYHHGYTYHEGLNIDKYEFNPTIGNQAGGFNFTILNKIGRWLNYSYVEMYYCWDVIIPDDARVYVDKHKFKTDKFILKNMTPIKDLKCWYDNKFCWKAVTQNYNALKYVINQSDKMCKYIVKNNGYAIRHVKNLTYTICMIAVEHDGMALQFIPQKFQTENICIVAVNTNSSAFQYSLIKTTNIRAIVKKQSPVIN